DHLRAERQGVDADPGAVRPGRGGHQDAEMMEQAQQPAQDLYDDDGPSISPSELWEMLASRWRLIIGGTLVAGVIGFGVASLLPKWYTAVTVILPPQQQQSAAAAAISQLGALAGLAGGLANVKSPADQYVALM